MKSLLTPFALLAACLLSGETIRVNGFENTDLKPGFPSHFTRAGAANGEIFSTPDACEGDRALAIYTPDPWSWSFFVNAFGPGELTGKTLRASCWMKTNNPAHAALVVTEGFVYGEAGLMMKFAYPEHAGQWEFVSVEWEIQSAAHNRFSVAVGHDYGSEKSWTVVDGLVIECGDDLPPLPEKPPRPSDLMDMRLMASGRNVAAEVRPILADLLAHPELPEAERAELSRRLGEIDFVLAGDLGGLIGAAEAREFEAFLDRARQWRLLPEAETDTLAFFDGNRRILPGRPEVRLAGAANEEVAFLLFLRNTAPGSRSLRFQVGGLPAEAVSVRRFHEVSGAPDYLQRLPDGESCSVGGVETAAFRVAVDTSQLTPGEHHGVLKIVPFDPALAVRELPVTVAVHPMKLAPHMPVAVFNWDYNSPRNPAALAELIDARVNFFNINHLDENVDAPDFGVVTEWAENFRRLAPEGYPFQLQLETYLPRNHGGWRPEFNGWLDRLVEATREAGLDYGDWNLHIYDETLSDEFLDAARQIKAHNPAIRIFSDRADADAERMRAFVPYVDYWCPLEPFFNDASGAGSLAVMRESGHPVMTYLCEPTPASGPGSTRLMPWRAWHNRLDGFGQWAFIGNRYRVEANDGNNYGFFYTDREGLSPSRRWLEWKEGIEDYLLLHAVAAAGPEGRRLADRAAAEVCAAVDARQPAGPLIEAWRLRLLEAMR